MSSALAACEIPPDPGSRASRAADAGSGVSKIATFEGGNLGGSTVESTRISPARGSVAGGTPVRVAAGGGAHPGWGGGGGDDARDAGCFFGPVAVRARWATAAEVECVTPSRGITAAAVRVAPVMDHRTRSFIAFGESHATFKYAMF